MMIIVWRGGSWLIRRLSSEGSGARIHALKDLLSPLEPCLRLSSLNLRWFYLVVLELGVPQSSSLEEALYKFSQWMNEVPS